MPIRPDACPRLRRCWRVIADPPASDFAFFLRNFALPVGAALFLARLLMGPMWGPGLTELVWMVVALKMTRQRDDARRVLAEDVAALMIVTDALNRRTTSTDQGE